MEKKSGEWTVLRQKIRARKRSIVITSFQEILGSFLANADIGTGDDNVLPLHAFRGGTDPSRQEPPYADWSENTISDVEKRHGSENAVVRHTFVSN